MKKPSITLWCQWVIQAWDETDPAIVIKGFKKCSISNALDGSEDNALYEDDDDSDSDPFADIDNEDEEMLCDDIES